MQISPVSPTQRASVAETGDAGSAYLNYEAFLRMLIAEMKNQDPTQPSDPAQYLSQLASFSSVEQGIKTNSKLDDLMTSLALSQADSLIGRTVTSRDGSVTGVIKSIEIVRGGSVAVLEDGKRVPLWLGVTIS